MKIWLIALFALVQGLFAAEAAAQSKPAPIAFTNVTLVPMDSDRLVPGQTVIVSNGRITAIAPTAAMTLPADLQQIDGTGRFLMPGLAEMHAHVPPQPAQAQWTDDVLFLYVANGITTARSMLGAPHHLELRARAERGDIIAPRLLLSGPSLNGNSVATPADGRRMVAEQKGAGYDFLKIHPGLDRPRYDAIAAAANAAGIAFGGHVPDAVGLDRAFTAGQQTIDHLDGYMALLLPPGSAPGEAGFFGYAQALRADPALIDAAVRQTMRSQAWLVPTESLIHQFLGTATHEEVAARDELRYVPKAMRTAWAEARRSFQAQPWFDADQARRFIELRGQLLDRLADADARLLLGSDAPQVYNVPGFAIHRELSALVASGLTPYQALASGTRNVGRFLGEEGRSGVIAKDARADLILLDANPLADVANLRQLSGVMVAGQWLPKERIDQGLAQIAARYRD